MPLLYREGEAGAFRRLQQEIIKDSDDQSILAWKGRFVERSQARPVERRVYVLLARSPVAFEHSHDIVEADSPMFEFLPGYPLDIRAPTIFDNKGLHVPMPLMPASSKTDGELFAVK